jgi:di/tricarboxylate transporter
MLDIVLVCSLIVIALVLFVSEKLRADLIAILVMGTLMLIGVFRPGFLSVEEAVSGFSNKATVTIAAMFILGSGLVRTGVVRGIGHRLIDLAGGSERRLFVLLMTAAGLVSAFLNNTAAVAVFLPITLRVCRQYRISPSRFLIPLSYISIVGGTCTLIGTSTNILVSSLSADAGLGEFGMFELAKLGAVFFLIGLLYLTLVRHRLLPDRTDPQDLTKKYRVDHYFTLLVLDEKSSLVQRTPAEAQLDQRYDVTVLEIHRGDERIWADLPGTKFHEGDELLVRGSVQNILEMTSTEGVSIRAELKYADQSLTTEETMLAEAIIAPSSRLIGRTLGEANFRHRYGVVALAIRKHGQTIRDKIGSTRLDAGDSLLIQGGRAAVEVLVDDPSFLVLEELETPPDRRHKAPLALATIGLVVTLAAFGVMPIAVSATAGCILLILSGCIKLQEAYDSIDWFVIFMLAGLIPLGIAMERTGAALMIADGILGLTRNLGPVALVSVFYLVTTVFASVMSHNAAAILLVPIGIATALEMGVSPVPILFAVTFAASSALSTPFGYHTNMMVYGPGGYRFTDYLKVGVPLNLLLWGVASFVIPLVWPLR